MIQLISASTHGRADAAADDPDFVLVVVSQVVRGAARAWPDTAICRALIHPVDKFSRIPVARCAIAGYGGFLAAEK